MSQFIVIHTHREGTNLDRVIADHHFTAEEYAERINELEGPGTVELDLEDEFVEIHKLRNIPITFMNGEPS